MEHMLDAAMKGDFTDTMFDESRLSALETKFAHYFSASAISARNVQQEKDKIEAEQQKNQVDPIMQRMFGGTGNGQSGVLEEAGNGSEKA